MLDLLHAISSTSNLATFELRVILHNTELYFPPPPGGRGEIWLGFVSGYSLTVLQVVIRKAVPPEKYSLGTSQQPFGSATPLRHLLPWDGPHLEEWAEEKFGPCRCYLLTDTTTPVLKLPNTHKAGVTDDIHTKSHIVNTLTPAPSHTGVIGAAEASDKREKKKKISPRYV